VSGFLTTPLSQQEAFACQLLTQQRPWTSQLGRARWLHRDIEDLFAPHDLLHRRRGEPIELEKAEAVLGAIGLRALVADWLLDLSEGVGDPVRVRIREVTPTHVTVASTVDGAVG